MGRFSLSKKYYFNFYASCGSTHKIEFAEQIHKFREHVSRNLYKGRKNVPVGRGFSSVFARKRGFEREAVRKTKFFDSLRHNEFLIVPQLVEKARLRRSFPTERVSPALSARPGKRAGKPCCARLPNPPHMSLDSEYSSEGTEGSVCPVGTWAEGPKRPEAGQRNHERTGGKRQPGGLLRAAQSDPQA